jgi:hypothetical protein
MRYIYVSNKGAKPMDIGINRAKRRAHRLDKQDRDKVVQLLGTGLPMQSQHHQLLVASRHRYYHDQHVLGDSLRSQSDGEVKP